MPHLRFSTWGFVLCLLWGSTAQAQEAPPSFVVSQWTVEDGLPVYHIRNLLQSQAGYLWRVTYDGLVRFDGARFLIFNSSNTPELPASRISYAMEDGAGNLWIQTETRDIIRYRAGGFTWFRREEHFGGAVVVRIFVDQAGHFWGGTLQGAYRYEEGRFQPFAPDVVTGLFRHDPAEATGHRLTEAEGVPKAYVRVIHESRHAGTLWRGTNGAGVLRYEDGRFPHRSRRTFVKPDPCLV